MTISELGYELYKIDWMSRIKTERKNKLVKEYYKYCKEDAETSMTVDDFVYGYGYDGQLYVCEEEFLNAEYLEEEYMKELFNNKELFEEYKKDLQENFYTD